MLFHGQEIRRDKIYDYFKDDYGNLETYLSYKTFKGEPYSGGWLTWPCHLIDIIKVLDIESSKKVK